MPRVRARAEEGALETAGPAGEGAPGPGDPEGVGPAGEGAQGAGGAGSGGGRRREGTRVRSPPPEVAPRDLTYFLLSPF